jgi:hypothetical protein
MHACKDLFMHVSSGNSACNSRPLTYRHTLLGSLSSHEWGCICALQTDALPLAKRLLGGLYTAAPEGAGRSAPALTPGEAAGMREAAEGCAVFCLEVVRRSLLLAHASPWICVRPRCSRVLVCRSPSAPWDAGCWAGRSWSAQCCRLVGESL